MARPSITLKLATSLDGKIALSNGARLRVKRGEGCAQSMTLFASGRIRLIWITHS
jgi:riboflavin biosynthesis pyrimidine reductase